MTWLCRSLLRFSLLMILLLVVVLSLIGSSKPLKDSLVKSHIYDNFVNFVLDKADQSKQNTSDNIPLNDPAIRSIIKQTFTPTELRSVSEQFLDGTYHWLDGKSTQPDFRIDLSSNKQAIANGVGVHAAERLKSLPPCQSIPSGDIDPFKIDCRPPGIDLSAEQQQLTSQVLNNQDFLPNPVITADTIPKNEKGRTFSEQFKALPKVFHWLKLAPWILGVLSALLSAAIIYLYEKRRTGWRAVGRISLYDGVIVFVTSLLFGKILPRFINALQPNFQANAIGPSLNNFIKAIIDKTTNSSLIASGVLIAIGIAILLAEKMTRSKVAPEKVKTEAEKPSEPIKETKETPQSIETKEKEPVKK